jgi:hypothetical protein
MDQNFQTSFIPKKPIVNERTAPTRSVGILFVISFFILITVLVATGGLYLYKSYLKKQIDSMQVSLTTAQNSFEPSKITELQTLDKRLDAATEILKNHINITPIFDALEQLTMKTVRYTKFNYDLSADGSAVDVKMSGQAVGYRAVALQADLFATNKNLINPVFSNLTLDNSGNVIFDLEFSVNPSFVNYQQTLLTKS